MNTSEAKHNGIQTENHAIPKCGIVMPISAIDVYSAEHWADVLGILKDVINSVGFEPNLVSYADDIGIIQKRIIQNLYNNEIVVCDVSAKNPNVMFELGIRLAFDKPTIIIKDDYTDYSFDTSVIEHLTYPKDLRFNKIVSFKENLKKKLGATFEKSKNDPNYSTFLKNFGEYKVAHLEEKEISSSKFILDSLEEIKSELFNIKRANQVKDKPSTKLSSLDALRQRLIQSQNEAESQMKDWMNSYFEKFSVKSSDVIENEALKTKLVEFVYDNFRPQQAISKNQVRTFIDDELLPF